MTYPRADDEESLSTNRNTASASAARVRGGTCSSTAMAETECQNTLAPSW